VSQCSLFGSCVTRQERGARLSREKGKKKVVVPPSLEQARM